MKNVTGAPQEVFLRKAEGFVAGYQIVIEPHDEFGYVGNAAELPAGFGRGKTREKCLEDTQDILTVVVATMLQQGGTPPSPKSRQMRTAQVNLRVTQTEKHLMNRAAALKGFRSVGDFVRFAVQQAVNGVFPKV